MADCFYIDFCNPYIELTLLNTDRATVRGDVGIGIIVWLRAGLRGGMGWAGHSGPGRAGRTLLPESSVALTK